MKYKIIFSSLVFSVFIPFQSQAFHQITEVLPSNKILICRDYNEVRSGQKVEVYKMKFSHNREGRELEKANEYNLPEVGKKIDLYHKDIHRNGRLLFRTHEEKLGSAIIIEPNLTGEKRLNFQVENGKMKKMIESETLINEKEAAQLEKNCIVAQPDSGIDLKEVQTIVY